MSSIPQFASQLTFLGERRHLQTRIYATHTNHQLKQPRLLLLLRIPRKQLRLLLNLLLYRVYSIVQLMRNAVSLFVCLGGRAPDRRGILGARHEYVL